VLQGGVTHDEIVEARRELRAELLAWIEERVPRFLGLLNIEDEDEPLQLPVIEDFRLLLCLSDAGGGPTTPDWYPTLDSGTAHHRQVGLLHQGMRYLDGPD
jgi:hypothetical protein